MKKTILFLLLIGLSIVSCKKVEAVDRARGELIKTELIGTISKSDLAAHIDEYEIGDLALYDVDVIRINYISESRSKKMKTDGILLVPKNDEPIYFMGYFHGTVIPLNVFGVKKSVPSLYDAGKTDFFEVRNIGLAYASAGYTVFMPDYIGYGSTAGEEHPYVYYPELFKACIDGMLACKTYFSEQQMSYDNRVFLGGWSQGGGASLSAHKYIQTAYQSEFSVVASSSLAGPHDCKEFLLDVFRNKFEEYQMVNIYSWALYVMNNFSDVKRPNDQIWKYPVFDQASSFNPPSKIPADIVRAPFMHKILSGEDVEMLNEINKCSTISGWTPVGKVFLHHGDADEIVPYFNSKNAEIGLTQSGGDVTLYTYEGGKHTSEVENFVKKTIVDFNLLK